MGFFDKIGEKASEVYNSTAEKTNKLTKEMKLKSTINDTKGKINKLYQEIGEDLFNKYQEHKLNEIEKDFSEQFYQLELYKKEIDEAQNEIYTLKNIRLCEKCQKEMNSTAKFCPFCGAEQKNIVYNTDNLEKNDEKSSDEDESEIQTQETIIINEESKREPIIEVSNNILDIQEPKIIVEEIGNNNEEEA